MAEVKKYPFLDLAKRDSWLMDDLSKAANRVISSGRYIGGNEVINFESKLAHSVGTRHAVAVGNGLDALRLVLRAWKELGLLKAGDEVILPANTYIASYLAVTDSQLVPVGVDIDASTFNLDAERVAEALSDRTRVLMPVHLYGRTCWNEALKNIATDHNLLVLEDSAQAIGAEAQIAGIVNESVSTGALGHAAAFSFYPTKNIGALGDAGAVTTSDSKLADTVRALANYGSDRRYHNIYAGFNSRMDPIQAAMLSVKLDYLDQIGRARHERASLYDTLISNPRIVKPSVPENPRHAVWHQYVIRSSRRDELKDYLASNGVGTDIHYAVPPHAQPCYSSLPHRHVPVTDLIAGEILSLPISEATSLDDITVISEIINHFS